MTNSRGSKFSLFRVLAVTSRVLTQFRRDRRTLGMMIMMPAVIMLVFGFTLGGEVSNIPIIIDNQDLGYTYNSSSINYSVYSGEKIMVALQASSSVKVTTGDFSEGKLGVDSGNYFASVLIPSNFSQTLFLKSINSDYSPTIKIYLDGTKPPIVASVLNSIQSSIQNASEIQNFNLNEQYAYGGTKFSGLDVSLPSVIAWVLTFLILLISLLTISKETTSGTLPRLYTTPLTSLERLLGYTFALMLLAIMMVTIILAVGIGLFGVIVRGNLFFLFSAAFLYALSHVLMAIFLSNFAKNELQAIQLAPLIALPSMALSGMLVPVNSLPDWIQPISALVPLYYGNKLFEYIMLKAYSIGELTTEFLIIGGIAGLFMVLALMTVKDQIDA